MSSPSKVTETPALSDQDELDVELEALVEVVSPKNGEGGKINEVRLSGHSLPSICINLRLTPSISTFRACRRSIDS